VDSPQCRSKSREKHKHVKWGGFERGENLRIPGLCKQTSKKLKKPKTGVKKWTTESRALFWSEVAEKS
jgi:hypothetical protein